MIRARCDACDDFYMLLEALTFHFEKTKVDKVPSLLPNSKALQKVQTGSFMLYDLCRKEGKPLLRCLRKMQPGKTTNGRKHLNGSVSHQETIQKLKAEEEKEGAKKVCLRRPPIYTIVY